MLRCYWREDLLPALIIVALVVIATSPSTGGFLFRGAVAAIFYWVGLLDSAAVNEIASRWHW